MYAILNQKKKHKTGFSLVEAAIVLAIIGLVIGGIWIVAAQVRMNNRVNAIVTSVYTMQENMRTLFNRQSLSSPYVYVTGPILQTISGPGYTLSSGGNYLIGADGTQYHLMVYTGGDVIPDWYYVTVTVDSTAMCTRLGPQLRRPNVYTHASGAPSSGATALSSIAFQMMGTGLPDVSTPANANTNCPGAVAISTWLGA